MILSPRVRRSASLPWLASLLAQGVAARADTVTIAASNNVTVQPGGPRQGANGQRFFNIEGSSNGTFSSFGVADFQATANPAVVGVTALAVTLTQTNAAFTANGLLNFYLTQDTTTVATQTGSPLTFQSGSLPDGIGMQLSPRLLLGQGTFTQVAPSTLTSSPSPSTPRSRPTWPASSTAAATSAWSSARDATVSATYDGFTNTTAGPPGPSV